MHDQEDLCACRDKIVATMTTRVAGERETWSYICLTELRQDFPRQTGDHEWD